MNTSVESCVYVPQPFVVSISDLEHVHFERVDFNNKNFDMTIIWKDLKIPPKRITSIGQKDLDVIQAWLDDINVTFTAGSVFRYITALCLCILNLIWCPLPRDRNEVNGLERCS